MKHDLKKIGIVLLFVVGLLFLFNSQFNFLNFLQLGSIVSVDNVQFEDGKYWVASVSVNGINDIVFSKNEMKDVLNNGSKVEAKSDVSVYFQPLVPKCFYNLKVKKKKACALGGFWCQDFEYYTLSNPERKVEFKTTVKKNGVVVKDGFKVISEGKDGTNYYSLADGKVVVKTQGILGGTADCPSPANTVLYFDGKEWKLGDSDDFFQRISQWQSAYNNVFPTPQNALAFFNSLTSMTPITEPTWFNAYPTNVGESVNQGKLIVRLPVGSKSVLATVKVSADLADTVTVIEPKGKPVISLSWDDGIGAVIETGCKYLVVDVLNDSDTADTFKVIVSTEKGYANVLDNTQSINVNAHKKSSLKFKVCGVAGGVGTEVFNVKANSVSSGFSDTDNISLTFNPLEEDIAPKEIPPANTDVTLTPEKSNGANIYIQEQEAKEPGSTSPENLLVCGQGTHLVVAKTPVFVFWIFPAGIATETQCVPDFPFLYVILALVLVIIGLFAYPFVFKKKRRHSYRRRR